MIPLDTPMWRAATFVFVLCCTQTLFAAKPPEWVSAELPDVEFKARLVQDLAEIQSRLGDDLDQEFILVEIEVRPLYNAEIILKRDDFLLRSYRNNERSYAQSPERIAGEAVLVLGEGGSGGGGVFAQDNSPVFGGGLPGLGPAGYPSTGVGVGGGGGGAEGLPTVTESQRQSGPLAERLAAIELPIAPTREPVRGFLFFQVDPKHKIKHLVLNYDGSAGECRLPFKPE